MAPLFHEGHQRSLEGCLFLVSYVVSATNCNVLAYFFTSELELQDQYSFSQSITKTYMALSTDLGPAVASLISSGPRTSSPSTAMDRAVSWKKKNKQPSGTISNTWFTVLLAASLTVSCSVLSISCHYPYLLSPSTLTKKSSPLPKSLRPPV